MGNKDPRTWARRSRRHRITGFVMLGLAVVALPVAGPAPAVCLVVIAVAYLLTASSVQAAGEIPTWVRILMILTWAALIEAVLTSSYHW